MTAEIFPATELGEGAVYHELGKTRVYQAVEVVEVGPFRDVHNDDGTILRLWHTAPVVISTAGDNGRLPATDHEFESL